MEKVKLTREQARAVEHKKKNDGRGIKAILNDIFYEPKFTDIRSVNEVIREIGMENFIKSLYIGYEVEETFEVGDWVITDMFDYAQGRALQIRKINKRAYESYVYFENTDHPSHNCRLSDIDRHATPEEIAKEKERRWWARHGREVWKLKQKDILVKGNCESIVDHVGKEDVVLIKNGLKVVVKMFNIKKYYRVRYFAEDRKDVDHDNQTTNTKHRI